jgi:hypothetical protein
LYEKKIISQSLSGSLGRQEGFIQGAILFGIALLTAVIGGFAMANRTPTSQTTTEQAKVNASVFLKQAADLSEGVARFAFDGGSVAAMTFDNASGGLFETSKQYALVQRGPAGAYGGTPTNVNSATQAGSYALKKNVLVPSVGTTADDTVVSTVFTDVNTCRRINNMLYGTSITAAPPDGVGTATAWAIGAGAVDLSTSGDAATISGWSEGCLTTATAGSYVYFKVVKES